MFNLPGSPSSKYTPYNPAASSSQLVLPDPAPSPHALPLSFFIAPYDPSPSMHAVFDSPQSFPPFVVRATSACRRAVTTVAPRDIFGEGPSAHPITDVLPETQPIAGPSRLPESRVQPKRAAKRKHKDQENDPVAKSSARLTKRKKLASSAPLAPVPSVADTPSRRRRTKAELEQAVIPEKHTPCGLGGCGFKLHSQEEARAPARTHYSKKGNENAEVKAGEEDTTVVEPKPAKGRAEAMSAKSPSSEDTNAREGTDHSARQPLVCTYEHKGHLGEQCRKRFSTMLGLSRHLESTHYGWMFFCPKCGGSYSRRDVLQEHLKRCNGTQQTPP